MLFALMLAAASAATAAPAPAKAPVKPAAEASTLDMVPAFVGVCMEPGPEPGKIRDVVTKAGGTPPPQAASPPTGVYAYLFQNGNSPYSVIFDDHGSCSIVAGRVDLVATRSSLDRLVQGSSKVFDVSKGEAKPNGEGEVVTAEYLLTSKNKHGGLRITLSRVTREGKGTAVFLTRRMFSSGK